MSEFGLKIKNYQAASIYEYQYGFRDRLDETNAMLTNSLFLDFLLENGLEVWKEESTRDVVCVEFEYGTKDYDDMVANLEKRIEETDNDLYKKSLTTTLANVNLNKEFCHKISKSDLRVKFYTEGFQIEYRNHNKEGQIEKIEVIKYKMLYRTPGKAKKGTCMFIRQELYEAAHNFLWMGLKLSKKNAPIVEIGAYSSLITSTIVGKVQIKPEEILILKDVDAYINTKAIVVNTDKNKQCYVERINDYRTKNTIFDGQALIDSSIFPEWGDGYILLRQHFTKCAAFNTHIQKFMKEYYGNEYETAVVEDMFGRQVRVKDIKLITTDNAIKFLKFDVSFNYWAEWVRSNGSYWGIVKTAHPSKFGEYQRMSYQMVNSLNLDTMGSVVENSVNYINKLKTDNEFFVEYLRQNINFSNDFEVLVALVEHNPDFINSDYFRDRKKKIISSYVMNFKSGKTLQNADNLTIVGSPYAMLLHSVGEDPFSDPTFEVEDVAMQCWTARFRDGEYLAEFRSPFNSRNNLGYMHNHYHEYFDKYFDLGKLCVAVNMIGTVFQDKNNGSDQDSDSIYTTNQPDIVSHAKYCMENYPTVVNKVPKMKNEYDNSLKSFALVDNKLSDAQLAIGQSSNLAQLCLTYTYNFDDEKYDNLVNILAVLA